MPTAAKSRPKVPFEMALGRRFRHHQVGHAASGGSMLLTERLGFDFDEAALETDQSLACHETASIVYVHCQALGSNALAVHQRQE